MKTFQPTFLRDRIYDILKTEILRGDQPAGEEIREGELAKRFGTSKTPVREALARLVQERLVELFPRVGYRVSEWSSQEALSFFEFREIVECAVGALAAQYVTAPELAELEALCQKSSSDSPDLMFEKGRRFHLLLASASRNPYLADCVNVICDQNIRMIPLAPVVEEEIRRSHRSMVVALKKRDAGEARRAMCTTIEIMKRVIIKNEPRKSERKRST